MLPKLIGLSGGMGSGKDAAVEHLVAKYGYHRIAFADAIKKELEDAIRHKAYPDGMSLSLYEDMLLSKPEEVYVKPTNDRIRRLLQYWGSEYRRADNEEYWVHIVENELESHPDWNFAISDVRFANESAMIHRRGGRVWMIRRKDRHVNGFAAHPSETLRGIKADHTIDNNGTLEDLHFSIDALVCAVRH